LKLKHDELLSRFAFKFNLRRYTKAGIQVSKQEVITIVRKYDENGDNRVSIEEFFDAFNFKFEN